MNTKSIAAIAGLLNNKSIAGLEDTNSISNTITDAIKMKIITGVLCCCACIICITIIWFMLPDLSVLNPFPKGDVELGGTCKKFSDCKGWGTKAEDVDCCNGICTAKQKDWAGIGYCPDQCKDAPAPLGGRCDRNYSWKRLENEPCDTHFACKGWIAAKPGTLACCNKTCKKLIKKGIIGVCPA